VDEARARVYLAAARKPPEAWEWVQEFAAEPADREADGITVAFRAGTDALGGEVARWSFKDSVKLAWPIDDAKGREVISRHLKVDRAALVPPGSVLRHRFVFYSSGHTSRFENTPFDVRETPTEEQKEAWRNLAKDFAGRGVGAYECVGKLAEFGEWILVHPGPYQETVEVGFFTTDPGRVRAFSWDTKRRRLALFTIEKSSPELVKKLDDAALLEVFSFSAAAASAPPPVEALELRKHELLFPAPGAG
jgi:hypothetical protein